MRLLLVEDDTEAAEVLTRDLRRHGYEVQAVGEGYDAMSASKEADLVVLNLDLRDLDGLEITRRLRDHCDVPIIAVSKRDTEMDRVIGLQAGLDDYLGKPYGFSELLARIQAVMRRAHARPTAAVVTRGPLQVNLSTREVTLHGRAVELTRKEFDLLALLASKPDAIFSRRQLMSEVWDDDWSEASRTIDTHVSSLRGKLGGYSWIRTVRGVGFRFGHG
ncbi:putative two-component system response regulator [Actinacidiphila reveromycinica]|uniref:Sensory transduction protein RegX3 n=1 Tax=Actinacidiphila reveromycinica TaxID=659352 RepID=A0A7U3UR33_9ACTN|nr:response regulator transcription factor [Streptomyces sp. SN-593]BBA97247.1 putative two-component system response regulator [Streptomyces sp. SN-593]